MTELTGLNQEEMRAFATENGLPAFRGNQLCQAVVRGLDFPEMTALGKADRERLAEIAVAQPVRILERYESTLDDTVKYLFAMRDGNCVEGVLMHYHYGWSLCISTQVGCRMGCKFCASTLDGCVRNLTAGEMLGEILAANRFLRERGEEERVSHVVLMGSGEPLDNYENVIRFFRLLREENGLRLSLRNVSLSTCGLVPRMRQLAEENLPVTLCVSLHAPNDEVRRQTMPIANRYSMEEILDACRYYVEKTGRRVIFEYALVDGVNSAPAQARELAGRLRGLQCHVNLIPLNEVREWKLRVVREDTVRLFLDTLTRERISATRRREMGDDIDGACGQLRRKTLAAETGQTGKPASSGSGQEA